MKYSSKTVPTDLLTVNAYLGVNKIKPKQVDGAQLIPSIYAAAHWTGASACTKIFRKGTFCKLDFFEGKCCDDLAYVLPALAIEEKIAYVRGIYYYYVQREGSTENRLHDETRQDVAHAVSKTINVLEGIKNSEDNIKLLIMNSGITTFRKLLLTADKSLRLKYIEEFYNRLSEKALNLFLLTNNKYLKFFMNDYYNTNERIFLEKAIIFFSKGECKFVDELYNEWVNNPSALFPKVSIVIPVYNGSNYMRDAIGSALAQTYPNIEVIVVNDGSNDDGLTDSIAKSYGNRIRYFKKENGGVATALNYGLHKMEGEYFAWLSHDDIYDHNKISNEVDILIRLDDKTTFLAGGYTVVSESNTKMYDVNLLNQYTKEELGRPLFAVFRGGINGCATLIHKSHFDRVGHFDPSLPTTQDYDLWFRMLRGQKLYYYDGCYVRSRAHGEQGSKKFIDKHIEECNSLWIGMMASLTDKERTDIDGSPLLFYYNTARFLESSTGYIEAIAYAKRQTYIALKNYGLNFNDNLRADEFIKSIYTIVQDVVDADFRLVLSSEYTKPRIVFLLGELWDKGGLTKVSIGIANMLSDQYEVFLIGDNSKKHVSYDISQKVKIINLGINKYSSENISRLLLMIRTDLFIMSFNCIEPLLPLYGICREMGIKTIAWNHEFYFLPYWNSALFNCLECKNIALAQADAAIWLNSFSANAYALLHDNAVIMHNPVTIEQPKKIPDNRPKNIVAMSRFDDPRKGLKELLYVFSEVTKSCPESTLYILGSYDLDQLVPDEDVSYAQLIKRLNLPKNRLRFMGWVDDAAEYLLNARVHLMPSKYEGFGLVITEAAAYGLPSVVFEGSGLDDIIIDGVDGRILPSGDIKGMANAVVELLQNDNIYNRMSNETINIVNTFSMEKVVSRWRDLIETVMTKSGEELNACLAEKFMFPVKNQETFIRQFAGEYEKSVTKLAAMRGQTWTTAPPAQPATTINFYKNEYDKMLNTLSWRITKPLRLVRIAQNYCRANGFKATIKRILEKMKKK